jgi:PAS domain S-box-containing protein
MHTKEIDILYVEDDPATRETIAEILNRRVDRLFIAVNGSEGLELFLRHKPSIVVTDIKMPVMDGLTMAKEIKNIEPATRIVITTAYTDPDYLINSIGIKVDGYVVKPVDSRMLISAIDRCSEIIRLEHKVRQQRNFSDVVMNTINDAVYIINAKDFSITAANRVFLENVGMQEKDIIGRKCFEITHKRTTPCQAPDDPCPLLETLRTGNTKNCEHIHYDLKDNRIYVDVSTSPIRNDKGEITHVLHVDRNITEKKHLEEKLLHAQKLEAVGRLAGGIAHDFNNILTAVIGYGSLIRSNLSADDPNRRFIEHVLSASEKAASLTRSLLVFSRKQLISLKPANVNDIIRNIEKILNRLIGEDIKMEISLSSEDLMVMADSGQIEQVLMNLATNARDAMPDGGSLNIKTEKVVLNEQHIKERVSPKPGDYARISVTDTGTGMDEKTRMNIFEPFFTTKEAGKGTGLGLAVSYGIITQHGGAINVYSEPEEGSIFKIYLPLISSGQYVEKPHEQPAIPLTKGTETILLAEDNIEVRELIKTFLEGAGYTVITAADGEDAVEKFKLNAKNIDIIITDVIMPKKNGKDVHDEIKKLRPEIKTLFMSGYTDEIIHKKGLFDSNINFMSKPVIPDHLLMKVREILNRNEAHDDKEKHL